MDQFRYFTAAQADDMLLKAFDIIEKIGIAVSNPEALAAAQKAGFREKDGRLFMAAKETEAFLNQLRRWARQENRQPRTAFNGMAGIYSSKYHDAETGDVCEFTEESLIRHARFVEKVSRQTGIDTGVPGYAADVPPELESLHKFKVCAQHCSGGLPTEPTSLLSAKYMLEMAKVLERPITRMPVYPVSPLCLSGDSFDITFASRASLTSAYVFAMPAFGVSAPLHIPSAFALCLAEVIGCAHITHAVTGLPVDIRPNLFPFDFRTMTYMYGTPEKFLFEAMSAEVLAHTLQTEPFYDSANIHTMAPVPSVYAASQKGTLMAYGAALGARYFYCLGSLALDEVFSPVQMLMDVELLQNVAKMTNGFGVPAAEPIEDLTAYVRENLKSGFMATDLTLDEQDAYVNYSAYYKNQSFAQWRQAGQPDALALMRERALAIDAAEPVFELDAAKYAEIEKLYKRAVL